MARIYDNFCFFVPRFPYQEFDPIAVSQLSRDLHRLQYIVQLSSALQTSASKLLAQHESLLGTVVPKLSRGIASLPDELLALVFKHATQHAQEGTRHALWLSHVSSRFRRIALGDRSLWSTQFLWYDMTDEGNIDDCICRSGEDDDLHIVVNYNEELDFSTARDFLDCCIPFASRWKSFALGGYGTKRTVTEMPQ